VARSNKRCRKIHKWLWSISKNKEYDRDTSREVKIKWDTREAINISNSGLNY